MRAAQELDGKHERRFPTSSRKRRSKSSKKMDKRSYFAFSSSEFQVSGCSAFPAHASRRRLQPTPMLLTNRLQLSQHLPHISLLSRKHRFSNISFPREVGGELFPRAMLSCVGLCNALAFIDRLRYLCVRLMQSDCRIDERPLEETTGFWRELLRPFCCGEKVPCDYGGVKCAGYGGQDIQYRMG